VRRVALVWREECDWKCDLYYDYGYDYYYDRLYPDTAIDTDTGTTKRGAGEGFTTMQLYIHRKKEPRTRTAAAPSGGTRRSKKELITHKFSDPSNAPCSAHRATSSW
jgi:hypothetical protein